MNSELLSYVPFDAAYILVGMAALMLIMLIMIIVCLAKLSNLKKKYAIFMKGESAGSLEKTLIARLQKLDQIEELSVSNQESINEIFENLTVTVQKYGMVKYDAFEQMGGKLSFSLALLNKKDDGIVINAVHTSEGCYTYIKEIIHGESVLLLTDEEREAIDIALGEKK